MIKEFVIFVFIIINIVAKDAPDSGCNSPRFQTGEGGNFSSMLYPQNYVDLANCTWLISVPAKKIIKLTFDKNFEIESSSIKRSCYDSVEVFNGHKGKKIGDFCGNVAPRPIYIRNNKALVKFNSDSSDHRKGFRIQWNAVENSEADNQESGCGSPRLQSGEEGTISSMNYPQKYNSSAKCEWLIQSIDKIKLTFGKIFTMESDRNSINCYDYVEVFKSSDIYEDIKGEKVGEYCGQIAPNPIIVNSKQIFVTFNSDSFEQFSGFSIQWNAIDYWTNKTIRVNRSGCNSPRLQSGERGYFSSMNYPSSYAELADCEWLITVPAKKIIRLTFNDNFRVDSRNNCSDSVKVFNGLNSPGEPIGVFCGNVAPHPIYIRNNEARVTFNSDKSDEYQYNRFSLQWDAVDDNESVGKLSSCNSERWRFGKKGWIYSRESVANCEYIITVPSTKIIQLNFEDLRLEKSNQLCAGTLSVFKGLNSNGEKIGEYCENALPNTIFVKSHQTFLTFKSGFSERSQGFSIHWFAVDNVTDFSSNMYKYDDGEYYLGKNETTWYEARDVCRSIWGHGNGDLVSFNTVEELDYLYHTTKGNKIQMAWIGANDIMEEGKFVWTDNSPVTLNRWYPDVPQRSSNKKCVRLLVGYDYGFWQGATCCLKMWFICERKKTKATKDIEQSGCQSPKLQIGFHGNFSSMNYPASYQNLANCSWLITVPTSKVIQLKFDGSFQLQKNLSTGFCLDFIEVFEGTNSSGAKIGTYCGKSAPAQIVSKSSQVFVTFTSDKSFEYKGFNIQWSAAVNVTEAIDDDPNIFKWKGSAYYISEIKNAWQDAREFCREIWGTGNGDLVTINNEEENVYVFKRYARTIENYDDFWIGANDITAESNFVWTDDSPLQFSKWQNEKPSNNSVNNCVRVERVESIVQWTDLPCCLKKRFICERKRYNDYNAITTERQER